MLRVISLDRTPQRYEDFLCANQGVAVERFSAMEGGALSREECVRSGLITEDNLYRPGALGHALSHIALWRECAAGAAVLHVAEDDVVLRRDFAATAARVLRGLPEWDIVLWTHNLDWPVQVQPPGTGRLVLQYDPGPAAATLDDFVSGTMAPVLLKLISAASTACYSISPAGAARALADCMPCSALPARYAARPDQGWRNTALDVEMSRHYAAWNAYVAVPPLAIAPNDVNASTIRGHLAALHDPAATCRAPY